MGDGGGTSIKGFKQREIGVDSSPSLRPLDSARLVQVGRECLLFLARIRRGVERGECMAEEGGDSWSGVLELGDVGQILRWLVNADLDTLFYP